MLKYYSYPAHLAGSYVQTNDLDQVAFWAQFYIDPQLNTFVFRQDNSDGGPIIAQGNPWEQVDTPFLYLTPFITMSNNGRVVFSGDLREGGTVLASRASGSGPHEISSRRLTGSPEMFPMVSDDNRTIVRGGANETHRIVLFLDQTLNEDNSIAIAEQPEYVAMGQKPGISDDGRVFTYLAEHG